MDEARAHQLSLESLKQQCAVLPNTNSTTTIRPYSIYQNAFQRNDDDDDDDNHDNGITTTINNNNNKRERHAWIYAPPCHRRPPPDRLRMDGSNIYVHRNDNCTLFAGHPSYLPTKYQLDDLLDFYGWKSWEDQAEYFRYDNYLWMGVSHRDGTVSYAPESYGTPDYFPPPPRQRDFQKQICFVGDSHARYLYHESQLVINNLTLRVGDGCVHNIYEKADNRHDRFRYIKLLFADEWLAKDKEEETKWQQELEKCSHIVLSYGHWESGWPREYATTPNDFRNQTRQLLHTLERMTAHTTRAPIWTLSLNLVPLGYRALSCPPMDWRLGPLVDAYNTVMHDLLLPNSEFRKTTYFVDNTDLNDPLWDSSLDYVHPCRNVFRPMASRMLHRILNHDRQTK
uniref:Uncharacterized protein n=1 Tax=Cyclophora tenuis TaxID=216820 RepID=A0A7S1D0J7_CYCTE